MATQLKTLKDVASNEIANNGLGSQKGLAQAQPLMQLPGSFSVTMQNKTGADIVASLMKSESLNYTATGLTVLSDDGATLGISSDASNSITGFRNFFKKLLPYVVGVSIRVADASFAPQFSKNYYVLRSDGKNQQLVPINSLVADADTGDSNQQILRVLELWGEFHDLRDLLVQIQPSTTVVITFNVAWYQRGVK